jgi:ribosomal-protein-alanine N-acetyltransferase
MGGANQPARDYATFRFGAKSPTYESDRRKVFAAYEDAKRMGVRLEVVCGLTEPDVPRKKLFSEIPRITGERVVLDRVVDADADALRDLIGNPLVQRYLPTYLFEKQFDDVHEAIAQLYGQLFQNKESLILAIRDKRTGELAGLAEFYGLRDELHKVSMGYRLRECFWGKGLATEAARLMVGYLYGQTDIEIITASTMVENDASAHVLENADFIRTARGIEEDWGFPEPTIVDKWFC